MSYWQNLQAILETSGPKPIYTWVSDNGRIELSVVTFANAVSKASNFISEGLELDPGTRVKVALGNHWQSPVWAAAAFSTNLQLVTQESEVIFGSIENEATKSTGGAQFVVVSKDPFGMPEKQIPEGAINGSLEVRSYGDYFAPVEVMPADTEVFTNWENGYTWEQLSELAKELASSQGLNPGSRFGIFGTPDELTSLLLQVVLPVQEDHSVVLIDQMDPDFEAVTSQEKLSFIFKFQ
jgi:uncharacterized protein (TIGR03089 family)